LLRRPPTATPLPYTTLFRSVNTRAAGRGNRRGLERQRLGVFMPRGAHPFGSLSTRSLRSHANDPTPLCARVLGDLHHFRARCAVDRKSTRLNSSHVKTSYAV